MIILSEWISNQHYNTESQIHLIAKSKEHCEFLELVIKADGNRDTGINKN